MSSPAQEHGDAVDSRILVRRNPTSELDLHQRVRRAWTDVGSVVHIHPSVGMAFAVTGGSLSSWSVRSPW